MLGQQKVLGIVAAMQKVYPATRKTKRIIRTPALQRKSCAQVKFLLLTECTYFSMYIYDDTQALCRN